MLSGQVAEELLVLDAIFPDTLQKIEDSEVKYKILVAIPEQPGKVQSFLF